MEPEVTMEPIAVRRTTAAKLLDCTPPKVWQLQREGKLDAIKVGADDRITVESIRRFATAGSKVTA